MKNTKHSRRQYSKDATASLMVEEIPGAKTAYFQGSALPGAPQAISGDEEKKVQIMALAAQSFVALAKREGFTKAKLIALINEEWKETSKL